MKTASLIGLGVSLLLAVGCATPSRTHQPPAQPAQPGAPVASIADDLLVISAVYGSGTAYADVTYRVNSLVHQPTLEFTAKPEWLQADPTPGWNKALVVVYEFKGRRHTFSCGEGARVSAEILVQQAKK